MKQKIVPNGPSIPRFEPSTFQLQVQHSTDWATRAPLILLQKYNRLVIISKGFWKLGNFEAIISPRMHILASLDSVVSAADKSRKCLKTSCLRGDLNPDLSQQPWLTWLFGKSNKANSHSWRLEPLDCSSPFWCFSISEVPILSEAYQVALHAKAKKGCCLCQSADETK